MSSEVEGKADLTRIRYAQVWEDADVLLGALEIRQGDRCLAIASAGDNALAMLARGPASVVAVDLNPAQLACLELRAAAYRCLDHAALLGLIGSRPCADRRALYAECRPRLGDDARAFWDRRQGLVDGGIGAAGKFENYFRLFRTRLLPFVHRRATVRSLLEPRDAAGRREFYARRWNTWRWRLLFSLFFSRFVMGRLGRDPSFFSYVEGRVADRIMERARHALVELDPSDNPYLHWILTGTHGEALPFALRAENFDAIRANLDRLQWRLGAIEDYLDEAGPRAIDRFNLSDVFEYMSAANAAALLARLAAAGRSGGRLVYWNMLAPRARPEQLAGALRPLEDRARELHLADKAFFYHRLVIEEVV